MIDYITLLLVNTAAGLLAGACFLAGGLYKPNQKSWAAVFAVVGLVSFVMGVHMAAAWPIPGKGRFANVAFGEISVLFGGLMLGLALSLARGWSLLPISLYSAVVGVTSIVLGVAIWSISAGRVATGGEAIVKSPPMAAAGFILAGAGAILAPLALWRPGSRGLRSAAVTALVLAALVWLATGLPAYWMHLDMFSK